MYTRMDTFSSCGMVGEWRMDHVARSVQILLVYRARHQLAKETWFDLCCLGVWMWERYFMLVWAVMAVKQKRKIWMWDIFLFFGTYLGAFWMLLAPLGGGGGRSLKKKKLCRNTFGWDIHSPYLFLFCLYISPSCPSTLLWPGMIVRTLRWRLSAWGHLSVSCPSPPRNPALWHALLNVSYIFITWFKHSWIAHVYGVWWLGGWVACPLREFVTVSLITCHAGAVRCWYKWRVWRLMHSGFVKQHFIPLSMGWALKLDVGVIWSRWSVLETYIKTFFF